MSENGGIGFVGGLTLVFIVLKLTDQIDWSWWWVLSPLWIGLIICLVILGICVFSVWMLTPGVIRHHRKWKDRL